MEIPKNVEVMDWATSISWFDENGILCSISKKAAPQTMEETIQTVEDFKKMLNGREVCMLIDVTHSVPSSREVRQYAANEFPKFTKAIAMISDSPLGKMIANLFFSIMKQPYPTKMFTNEEEAKDWLKQYL